MPRQAPPLFSPHRLLPLSPLPSLGTTLVPSPLVYHVVVERSNVIADNPFVLHASEAIMPVPMCLLSVTRNGGTDLRVQPGDQINRYQDVLYIDQYQP